MAKWTEEDHQAAVLAYLKGGTYVAAQALCGVPHQTIAYWRNSCDWWDGLEREANRQLEAKCRSQAHKGIELAFERIVERIDKGDQLADGSFVPVKARDMAVILGILLDKSKIDLTMPTATGERQSADERRAHFIKLAEAAEGKSGQPN